MVTKNVKLKVKTACFNKANIFGPSAWDHIQAVVKYAKLLATKRKADIEICELSAWLHDYASLQDKKYYKDHHIHGARLAEEFLTDLNYPKVKIEKIKHCILTHRGSINKNKNTVEAEILADADAMAQGNQITTIQPNKYPSLSQHPQIIGSNKSSQDDPCDSLER